MVDDRETQHRARVVLVGPREPLKEFALEGFLQLHAVRVDVTVVDVDDQVEPQISVSSVGWIRFDHLGHVEANHLGNVAGAVVHFRHTVLDAIIEGLVWYVLMRVPGSALTIKTHSSMISLRFSHIIR